MRVHFLFYSLILHGLLLMALWFWPVQALFRPQITEFDIVNSNQLLEDTEDIKKFQDLSIKDPIQELKDEVHLLSEKALRFQKQMQKQIPLKQPLAKLGQVEKKYLPQNRLSLSDLRTDKIPLLHSNETEDQFQGLPSIQSEISRNLPQGQLQEIFPKIAEGGFTLLNADPLKYSGFYKRLSELISNPWSNRIGVVVYQTYPRNFTNVLINKWTTLVDLVLLPDGRILDVILLKKSGQEGFDRSALQTLRETLVIPNPPKSLLSDDGLFHLKISFNVFIEPQILAQDPESKKKTQ